MRGNSTTPGLLLVLITLVSIAVFVVVTAYGTTVPRLGMRLVPGVKNHGVFILSTDPGRRFDPPIAPLAELLAVGGVPVLATDLVAEPDSLETYAELEDFLARQAAFTTLLDQESVTLTVQPLGATAPMSVTARPDGISPWSLPDGFWVQLLTGGSALLIAGWVWALRPRSTGPVMFALSAVGLMLATATSAIYANRELAVDADAFAVMLALNHAGVILFGLAMIGLLLSYPRQLVSPRWWVVIPVFTLGYVIADANHVGIGPAQLYIFVALAMLGIIGATLCQWWVSRRSPSDRAALGWLGLSVIAGCGAFTVLGAAPVLLGTPTGVPQSHVTGVLIVIYAGLALGVSRYRLFELGDWAYRIFFYTVGAVLLLAIDAALIFWLNVEAPAAFGVALIFVGFVYLPLRDWVWRRLTKRRRVEQDELFAAALDVAFAPSPAASAQQWRSLVQRLFDPLEIEEIGDAAEMPVAGDDGLSLTLPAIAGSPPLRLAYPFAGRGLFAPGHLKLAANLVALTRRAEEGRQAYMRGVGEERRRMARDLHDDVGARLLTGLHTADERTRPTLQAALSDIRAIVSGLAGEEAELELVLAQIRHEAARRLEAAGIELDWPLEETLPSVKLDYRVHKAMTSAVREVVSNVIRHSGAQRLRVSSQPAAERLSLRFEDDGRGLPQQAQAGETQGFGLKNLRQRFEDIGGSVRFASSNGTSVTLSLPLAMAQRPREPGVPDGAAAIDLGA